MSYLRDVVYAMRGIFDVSRERESERASLERHGINFDRNEGEQVVVELLPLLPETLSDGNSNLPFAYAAFY